MKKYIINIVIFFAAVMVVDLCVGFAGDYLQAHAKGGSTKEFNDLVMNDEHDVLILGSSRAHHHYDTPFLSDTLGLDVYNAGVDGNGAVLADGILELVLKHSRPKLVLFDVEPAFDIIVYDKDNNHKRYIADLKPYYKTSEVGDIIEDVSKEDWYKVHSGLIRYNTDIIKMAIDNVIARPLASCGYSPLVGEMLKEPEAKAMKPDVIDDFKLNYMSRLIDVAREHDIPIALVGSPKYGKKDSNPLNPVKAICAEKQVPFLDYYAHPEFMAHKEWFKEPMHLNATGARVFSGMIAKDIQTLIKDKQDADR